MGNDTGFDSTPIFAEDFPLTLTREVRFVSARLSGSNSQVDFSNIGFTGTTTVPGVLLGDVNLDGVVNFLDIAPFIVLLADGEFQAEADIDQNGSVNFLDIGPFITILSNN